MDESSSSIDSDLRARVVELETLLMHLQRTLGELDQVVLGQQKQIESLNRQLGVMRAESNLVAGPPPEVRRPEDEKPPHY